MRARNSELKLRTGATDAFGSDKIRSRYLSLTTDNVAAAPRDVQSRYSAPSSIFNYPRSPLAAVITGPSQS